MRCNRFLRQILGTALLASAALVWAGTNDLKKIEASTASPQAKELLAQAVTAIESFDGAKAGQLAQALVKADSNFAFGYMLVAATTPQPQQRAAVVAKFVAKSKTASLGEQKYLEAMALFYDNKAEQAVPIFAALRQEYPGDRRVCMMLAQLNMNGGKYAAAIPLLEAANKLDDSTPRAHTFLGNCYLLQNEYAKAREYYKKAISKVGPDASPFGPFFGITFSYLYEGKPEPALQNEQEFLARYLRNGSSANLPAVWIYNNMARINLEFGNTAEAMRLYEEGYKTVPGSSLDSTQKVLWHGRLFHGTARTLARMGKYDEAWQLAEQIKAMIEKSGKAGEEYWDSYHYVAGYVKLESGDYAAAAEHLAQADKNNLFHRLLLARANVKLGNKAAALELYREVTNSTTSNMERALAYPEAKKMVAQLAAN